VDQKQRQRIIDKHRDSLTRFGYHPNALYWSGRDIQEIRFKVLADIGIQDGDSVLDVGYGFGDFKSWAIEQDIQLNYTGIDLSLIYWLRLKVGIRMVFFTQVTCLM